jgi:hypothetical protein
LFPVGYNHPFVRFSTMINLFFILYCFEAGLLLLFAPWSPEWDRIMMQLPFQAMKAFLLHPGFRGAVTGFGLVHLIWGTHDLISILMRRGPGATASPSPPPLPPPVPPDAQTARDQ